MEKMDETEISKTKFYYERHPYDVPVHFSVDYISVCLPDSTSGRYRKGIICDIGYDDDKKGFNGNTCAICMRLISRARILLWA